MAGKLIVRTASVALASLASLAGCGGEVVRDERGLVADSSASADAGGTSHTNNPPPASPPADAAPTPAKAGGPDGVCNAGDVRLGFYDPDCVYVLGTTIPGSIGHDVLFDPSTPSMTAIGFGYGPAMDTALFPVEGRVLFIAYPSAVATRDVYVFHPAVAGEPPATTFARHEKLGASCENESLMRIIPFVDESGGVYQCVQGGTSYWHIGSKAELPTGGRSILAFGIGRSALMRPIGGPTVLVDAQGDHAITGVDTGLIGAIRSRPEGGFWVSAVTLEDLGFPHLYSIAADGAATDHGAYHLGSYRAGARQVLEPDGALVTITDLDLPSSHHDGIVRFRLDALPEVVFDEKTSTVKLHGGELITGP